MQCAESPVATPTKKQKLQPSISFLVVSGGAPKNQANNNREFPVPHQWKNQLKRARKKPRQSNEPKNRGQGPNISAIDLVACGLWHPNGVQETRHPRSQASPAVWGTRPLVISAIMGQATLAAGAEVAMCRITNSQGPRGNKHCCHRPLSWWSLGL